MDDKKTQATNVPGSLPVLEKDQVEIHTMKQDMQRGPGSPRTQEMTPPKKIPTPPKPPQMAMPQVTAPAPKASMFDKFRKPKDQQIEIPEKMESFDQFKNAMPKAQNPDLPKTPTPTPTTSVPTPPPQGQMGATMDASKMQIKIPGEKSKLPLVLAVVVIILMLGGGGWYGYTWWKDYQGTSTTPTQETQTQEQPDVTKIPEPETPTVQQPTTPTTETPVVAIPEPSVPETEIKFENTITTTSSISSGDEFIKNLRADSKGITQNSIITRHLFKLSNEKEKRYLTDRELLNLFGINLPQAVWDNITHLEFVSYKLDSSIRYGIIANITNKDAVWAQMKNYELQAISYMRQLYMGESITVPESPAFSQNTYLGFDKRYINLPMPDTSFDFGVSDKYLVIATSKDMVFKTILLIAGDEGQMMEK